MSLSCSCDFDYDPEPGDCIFWFEDASLEFEKLDTSRRKKCCSCGEMINIGSICVKYHRRRYPYNEIESKINGVDWECFEEPPIPMADKLHCESCGEIYLNLIELGFECLLPSENMSETLEEYKALYLNKKSTC